MFWRDRYDAFVSYSHKDEALVKPMVEMLSLNERKVFWDRKLEAGDRWNDVIGSSVKRSSIFVLFWCCDTHASEYTGKEIALALRLKKKIVPVKLCPATMPEPLREWQWIDLQERVQHDCGMSDHSLSNTPLLVETPPRSATTYNFVTAMAACIVCFLAVSYLLTRRGSQIEPPLPPTKIPTDVTPPPPKPTKPTGPIRLPETVNVPPRIPGGAIRLPGGYAVIIPPSNLEAGRIRKFDERGYPIASYGIPSTPSVPVWPPLREEPLPSWYVNRHAILWLSSSTIGTALMLHRILKRRRRTEETITLAIRYFRNLEVDS